MKITLYKRQLELFNFIANYIQMNNHAPTLEEMRKALGLRSLATVHEHLSALEFKGVLRRTRARSRGIELIYDMTERELLDNMYSICVESVRNAAHTVVDIGRLNVTMIEITKRKNASL